MGVSRALAAAPSTLPLKNSIASYVIGVTTTFLALALSFWSLRLYIRIRASRVGMDDCFLTAGMVLGTGLFITNTLGTFAGIDRATRINVNLTIFIGSILYTLSSTCIKISIACLLLRVFRDDRIWNIVLRVVIVVVLALAATALYINLGLCRPIQAAWDLTLTQAHCVSPDSVRSWVIGITISFSATDLIFAILPIFVISKLHRPLHERIVVCVLMGLGLFCAAATVPKLVAYKPHAYDIEWYKGNAQFGMWTLIEVYLGIIAASAPALKSVFEKTLRKAGVLATAASHTTRLNNYPSAQLSSEGREDFHECQSTKQGLQHDPESRSRPGTGMLADVESGRAEIVQGRDFARMKCYD